MITTLTERMRGLASLFWREVAKFGAVGGIAFVIDNGLTYYLMHGPMTDSEAKARFFGASVATVFSWIANRFWTFRHRRQANVLREFVMFIIINGIGIGISTGFTAIAKYWLGITRQEHALPGRRRRHPGRHRGAVLRLPLPGVQPGTRRRAGVLPRPRDHRAAPARRSMARRTVPALPARRVKDPELPGPPA